VTKRRSEALSDALRLVAPGTTLREGIDRVLQARMGALIVVGAGPEVLSLCSGGFLLDAEFSPQRLSELAKMDGAIVLAADTGRIARANVHLVPDPEIPTSETGTRHRTAERVAQQIDVPVITVSEELSVVAIYCEGKKHSMETIPRVLARANQALTTLGRYKARLDAVTSKLSTLEVEDLVTMRDVASVLQRGEMVRRIAGEVEDFVIELGVDGRLIGLQRDELIAGAEIEFRLVIKDYAPESDDAHVDAVLARLAAVDDTNDLDLLEVASVLSGNRGHVLDATVQPRGYRLLSRIPRLSPEVGENLVDRFGTLAKIMRASVQDLVDVEGVGETRARAVKEGLARLAETSILDRYS
jgi:diadenylate cyclase